MYNFSIFDNGNPHRHREITSMLNDARTRGAHVTIRVIIIKDSVW